ncbi:MAG: Lrp/AsnC family transcriptional regulator [Armatimonadota bacterium]
MESEILRILEGDARATAAEVAAGIGVGVDVVAEAIARLEASGAIRSYRTVVDWERAGVRRVEAFVDVTARPERGEGYDRIAERIYRHPEVTGVHLVSGTQDLRVAVTCASIEAVAAFVAERVATIDGVVATSTHFVLRRYKEDGVVFAQEPVAERVAVMP